MDELKAFIEREIMMVENSDAFFEYSSGYAAGCKAILKHIETVEEEKAKAKKDKPMPNFGFDGQF